MAKSTPINGISGRCVVQFAQVGANNQVSTAPVPFFDENQVVHESSKIEAQINGPKMATHVLQVRSPDYINKYLIPQLASSTPFLQYRLGISSGNSTVWLPFERHVILNDTIQVLPDSTSGPRVAFRTADLLWLLGFSHVRTHKGPISSMVSKLWTNTTSSLAANTIIEPTLIPGRGSTSDTAGVYYQSEDTDLEFIKDRLLPRAVSTSGRSGYRFFVLDDIFHFHTPGYGQSTSKAIKYSSNAPLANDLQVVDRSVEYAQNGSTGVAVYSYDPVTGTAKTLNSSPTNVAIFSTQRGGFNGLVTISGHIGQNLEIDEQSKAQHLYSVYRNETYDAELTLVSNLDLRLGDIVTLQVSAGQTRTAYSGYWEVTSHIFSVDNSALTTAVHLSRGEIDIPAGKTLSDPNGVAGATNELTPNIAPATAGSGGTPTPMPSQVSSGKVVQVTQQ